MAETSNVIAAEYHHRVQRGADYEVYFQAVDADELPINWTLVTPKAQVKNQSGAVVAEFIIGDGLTVDTEDNTILYFHKAANEKNIYPGTYLWDFKVEITPEVVQYPLRGYYISVGYITA